MYVVEPLSRRDAWCAPTVRPSCGRNEKAIYKRFDKQYLYFCEGEYLKGAVELNMDNKNDKDLVVLMQSYVDAFMEQYK